MWPPFLALLLTPVTAGAPVPLARFERPVLALAFASADRVLVLEDERATLWRLDGASMVQEADLPLAAQDPVRWPGGLIHGTPDVPGFWMLRSGWAQARLLALEERGPGLALRVVDTAATLPWPAARGGLHFQAGTNWIEGDLTRFGTGPHAAVCSSGAAVVDTSGGVRLRPGAPLPALVARSIACPWPGVAVVASPSRLEGDSLLAVVETEGSASALAPMAGLVRALATLTTSDQEAVLLAAVQEGAVTTLVRLPLHRRAPDGR